MSAASNIYDLPGQIEPAVAAALIAVNLKAYTSRQAPEFKKQRPRVEVMFVKGPGRGIWEPTSTNRPPREAAWAGIITLSIFTAPDFQLHADYCTTCRERMSIIGILINGTSLLYHRLQPFFTSNGETAVQNTDEGLYRTDMSYAVDIAVQANAWDSLPVAS